MRGKLPRLQPGHRRPLFDNIVDRLRIERPTGNIPPAINRPKHTATFNLGGNKPGVQGINRPAGQKDNFIAVAAAGLCAAEMD